MLRYATWTTPLRTGEDADGAAYFGVVFTLTIAALPEACGLEVFVFEVCVPAAPEPDSREADFPADPQPAASTSAKQLITTGRRLLIGWSSSRASSPA